MSEVEYHEEPSLVSPERLSAVLQAACADPVSPATVVATLIRGTAIAICAFGFPDEETVEELVAALRGEIHAHAEALKQDIKN